jgi:pimeloyl-ACP methyl ester carboxylesterase
MVGTGPDVLVMIHGGPGLDMGYMVPDFQPLAERHRLLFYDQRGGGRSELLPDDAALYTMARHVADLEALRRHFGLERMTLVAHSFGPAIAASYAMAHPDRVARMVFLGPVPPRAGTLWARYAASLDARLTSEERALLTTLEQAMIHGRDPVEACRAYWAIAVKPRVERPDLTSRVTGDFCSADAAAVAERLQRVLSGLQQPAALDRELVRLPLVVHARRAHRFGYRHAEVEHVRDYLPGRGDDARAAARAGDDAHATFWIENQRRRYRREPALARRGSATRSP